MASLGAELQTAPEVLARDRNLGEINTHVNHSKQCKVRVGLSITYPFSAFSLLVWFAESLGHDAFILLKTHPRNATHGAGSPKFEPLDVSFELRSAAYCPELVDKFAHASAAQFL